MASKNIRWDDVYYILDILLTGIVCAFITLCLLNSKKIFYVNFLNDNSFFRRVIGVIVVCKALRFYKLWLRSPTLKAIFESIYEATTYVGDILYIELILIIIYGVIGLALYGGNLNSGSPEVYEEIYGEEIDENMMIFNFNDFYHSFLTLFMIM